MPVTLNGTNGLTFNDGSSQATSPFVGGFGFRNRIINGDMRIDQRNNGASVAITGGATTLVFGPDRWQVRSAGANASAQQVTVSGLRRLRFTGAASVNAVAAHQRIEATSSADLAGSQVTVSVKASSTSLTSLTIELYYANSTDSFGTWGSPTVTSIGSTAVTISTTEQTVSATFTVPSAATTGLEVRVTGGALLASQTLTIGDIQLEKGITATSFDYRPYGTELQLCQRYYYTHVSGTTQAIGVGSCFSATRVFGGVSFPVTMRAAPTISASSGTGFYQFYYSGTAANFSAPFLYISSPTNYIFEGTTAGVTTGVGGWIQTANASSSIAFSSEL